MLCMDFTVWCFWSLMHYTCINSLICVLHPIVSIAFSWFYNLLILLAIIGLYSKLSKKIVLKHLRKIYYYALQRKFSLRKLFATSAFYYSICLKRSHVLLVAISDKTFCCPFKCVLTISNTVFINEEKKSKKKLVYYIEYIES